MPSILCSCCSDCCGLFVKGAYTKPLRGQVPFARSRFVIEENPENCTYCDICVDNKCPVNAISMKYFPEFKEEWVYANTKECIGCGICVLSCPSNARKMKLERPPEHIPDLASALDG
jgi:Na+-translocating ferredoxin:NAD+ oxidoreductase subunit B